MADYDSSLPVRTEADVDERMQSKLIDYDDPTTGMTVDTDGNAHVEVHGNNPSGSDVVIRLSELGDVNAQGVYDVTNNSKPSSNALIGHQRQETVLDTHQTLRLTAVQGDSNTVCLDVSIRDESGNIFDQTNPLPVVLAESAGEEIYSPHKGIAIVKSAESEHTLSIENNKTFYMKKIHAVASGKMKIIVEIGDGDVTELLTEYFWNFNSTANPDCSIVLKVPYKVVGTANTTTIKVTKINLDNQPQDLYSTIEGIEF